MARILVADDNEAVAEIIQQSLEQFGFEVVLALNGQDALEIALSGMVDIALIDILMPPGIDGIAVLRAIREAHLPRHLPVVLLTALPGQDERERGMQAGADAYCVKPMRIAEMVPLLHSLLGDAPPAP